MVAARSPVHGLRVVGKVPEPLGQQLRQRHRRAVRSPAVRPGSPGRAAHRPDLDRPGLDRHHLAALCPPRQLGLLRAAREPTGLRQRLGHDLQARRAEFADAGNLESAPAVRRRAARPSAEKHPAARRLPQRREGRHAAGRDLDRAVGSGQRPPPGQRAPGPGLRHRADQRRHEEPGLEVHGYLPGLGRLGRLLRQPGPAADRRKRIRPAGACDHDLALCQAGLHRRPDAQQRRIPEVHRRRLSRRREAQPEDRRQARSPAGRPGRRGPTRQRGRGLQLQPAAAPASAAANQPADRFSLDPPLFQGPAALLRVHDAAPGPPAQAPQEGPAPG